jgi:Protein of unknown function (DUF3352)
MRRLWTATTILMLGFASLLSGPQAVRAADDVAGEKLLPKDTLLFVTIPDVEAMKEQWDKSLSGAMFQDPDLKPFLADVQKKIDELSGKLMDEIGVTIPDLLNIPSGEITFALMERPARKLSVVLMVDYGDSKETVEKLLKQMHEALDSAAEHSTEEIDKVAVHVFTSKDGAPNNPFKTLAYFNDESYLVFSSEVDALKEVLDRWDGDSDDTLANNDVFKYIQDKCRDESGEPAMKWYFNPIGLVQSGLNMAQSIQPQAGMVAPFLPMLGFDKLKGWGGAAYSAAGEFDAVSKSFVYADQPTGVLNMFQFPATELAPPKWVSVETSTYVGGNWNVVQAFQAIEGLVDMFQGRGALARLLDQAANADRGPGLHLKKDFLDLLEGKFHVVQNTEADKDKLPVQRVLVALDVNDAARMKKTLAKVAKTDGSPIESREFNGETVYEFTSPAGDQTFSFAVAAGHLVITNDTAALENMLRSETQPPLAEAAEYRKIARYFPPKVSMISYQHSDTQLKALYEMLKKNDNAELLDGIDLQKLPPFEVLQKYLRSSGSYTVPDKKGALTIGFQLREGDR